MESGKNTSAYISDKYSKEDTRKQLSRCLIETPYRVLETLPLLRVSELLLELQLLVAPALLAAVAGFQELLRLVAFCKLELACA